MSWAAVGDWIRANAGTGTALVGSMLTGNVPGAVAAAVAMVSSATGSDDPERALTALTTDPQAVIKLKALYYENEANIRQHIEAITRLKLEDDQAAHDATQRTIRAGDRADDRFVRWTRPGQSWLSLGAAFAYVFVSDSVEMMILGALLTLPWAYAGLRQIGKGINSFTSKQQVGK